MICPRCWGAGWYHRTPDKPVIAWNSEGSAGLVLTDIPVRVPCDYPGCHAELYEETIQ